MPCGSEVDGAVEFQLYEYSAPVIADSFARARIPLISAVNPHHGTYYFGVNNYRAGYSAGRHLAEYAAERCRDTLMSYCCWSRHMRAGVCRAG
jgi:hypothetical protein